MPAQQLKSSEDDRIGGPFLPGPRPSPAITDAGSNRGDPRFVVARNVVRTLGVVFLIMVGGFMARLLFSLSCGHI